MPLILDSLFTISMLYILSTASFAVLLAAYILRSLKSLNRRYFSFCWWMRFIAASSLFLAAQRSVASPFAGRAFFRTRFFSRATRPTFLTNLVAARAQSSAATSHHTRLSYHRGALLTDSVKFCDRLSLIKFVCEVRQCFLVYVITATDFLLKPQPVRCE